MAVKGRFAKMRLIPEEEYERLKQKIIKEYDPRLAAMVTASDQAVIPSGQTADPSHLKFQLNQYQHAMDTFRALKNNKQLNTLPELKHKLPTIAAPAPFPLAGIPVAPPPAPLLAEPSVVHEPGAAFAAGVDEDFDESAPGSSQGPVSEHPIFQLALDAVPTSYKRKAQQSIDFIKMHPSKINVNSELELVVNGVPQPGTNFVDLFASLYKAPSAKKSSVLPTYHSQFRNLLSEIHMPNSYLLPKSQTGKGIPPGRKPHILHVYK